VNPSGITLTNGQAVVQVVGNLFYNDSDHHYECVVSGVVFSARLIDTQTVECPLQYDSSNMPGTSSSQGNYLFIREKTTVSNSISVFFTAAPAISGATMLSRKRLYLTGTNIVAGGYCEYRNGAVTLISTRGSGFVCDIRGLTSTSQMFDVRAYVQGQVSNWVTVPIPASMMR